jgi:phosphoglycerol transferase MdoB-like AlkP superfamily enzyme
MMTTLQPPFLIGYSTLSSHEPWDVPTKQLPDEVDNAFSYLDSCLYRFISRLRQTPQWANTLIVLTADHGINDKDIDQSRPLEKNHVPMLWIGGAVKGPRTVSTLCNQSDLAATLLAQLRLSHDDFTFSRDVLSHSYTHPVAVNNYSNAQWIVDSTGHVGYDFDGQRVTVDDCRDSQQLLRVSKAILLVTSNDLQNR